MDERTWVRKWNAKTGRYDAPVQCRTEVLFHMVAKNYVVCGPPETNPDDVAIGQGLVGTQIVAGDLDELADIPPPDEIDANAAASAPAAATARPSDASFGSFDEAGEEDDELVVVDDEDLDMPPAPPGVTSSPAVATVPSPPKGKKAKG